MNYGYLDFSLLDTILKGIRSEYVRIFVLVLVGLLALAGLLLLVFTIFSGPTKETDIAFTSTDKRIKEHEKNIAPKKEDKFEKWAKKFAKYVKMGVYKRNELSEQLKLIGSDLTPEEHIAVAGCKAGLFIVVGLIMSIFTIWALPISLVIAFIIYRINYNTISKKLEERKDIIERSLPRFTSTLSRTIKKDRDIIGFLKRFKDTAPKEFQIELEILIADMQSGNQRTAIMRSINRVGGQNYSDVMRGVMSVIDGSDSEIFWETLNEKLSEARRLALEDTAERIPRRLKALMPFFVIGFILQYGVVIAYYMIEQFSQIF